MAKKGALEIKKWIDKISDILEGDNFETAGKVKRE